MRRIVTIAVLALLWGAGTAHGATQIPFAEAKIIIEFNATGRDAGIQVFLDGEAWQELQVVSPDGRRLLEVNGRGTLRQLGLTELFFESNEPSLDELPLDEFLALFPEGEYRFRGRTVEGDQLVGAATLTHCIPAGPVIVSPPLQDRRNTVIAWRRVTRPQQGAPECRPGIEIVGYQVIVGDFQVTLPGTATRVTVPPEFLEPRTEYLFEVLAIESGGNQTIMEGAFSTK